jgi:hypothetical protein
MAGGCSKVSATPNGCRVDGCGRVGDVKPEVVVAGCGRLSGWDAAASSKRDKWRASARGGVVRACHYCEHG